MSHTPRQAALLARLFAPDPGVRTAAILAHVADPVAAASAGLGPFVRAKLADTDPADRLTAAEYLWRVSGDPAPAAAELCDRFRRGDATEATDALPLLSLLGKHAAEPLVAFARGLPVVFSAQADDFVMWAARTVLTAGADGVQWFQVLLVESPSTAAPLLLMEFAHAVPRLDHDAGSIADAVRQHLELPSCVHAAGAALWRLTWRVLRAWLDDIARDSTAIDGKADLLALTTRVLIEHLGRRPDVAPLVRMYLVRLAAVWESAAQDEVQMLARLGGRGWGVLLLVLQESPPSDSVKVPDGLRAAVLREAIGRPAALALVRHHAHRFVFDRWEKRDNRSDELVAAAAEVLTAIGPPAGAALPDLLKLIGREPDLGWALSVAASAVAPGYPLATSAVVRALAGIRPAGPASRAAFDLLAGVLFRLDPDAGPALAAETSVDGDVVTKVLATSCWRDASAEVRAKHAAALADMLGSPRKRVRNRAAYALRQYLPEWPGVWPAIVAALTADELTTLYLLTCVRFLAPVADPVCAELHALFADPNIHYAAREGVALWRLGRWPEIAPRLRDAVLNEPADGRAVQVLRKMVPRGQRDHGILEDITALFAVTPEGIAAEIQKHLEHNVSKLDARLSELIRHPRPTGVPFAVPWVELRDAVDAEKASARYLVLAMMCGFGTEGFAPLKIWMIKHYRDMTWLGLAESKAAVERVMECLSGSPGPAERRRAVREFFPAASELPGELLMFMRPAAN